MINETKKPKVEFRLQNGDYIEISDDTPNFKIYLHHSRMVQNGEDDFDIEYDPEQIYPKV